jgi:hypothetical protein
LRLVEMAVVGNPAANARIVHLGQVSHRLVAAFVKRPTSDFSADARQRLGLAAGWKLCVKIRLSPLRHIVFLARNWNPRKSNEMMGESPRRFTSLQ